METRIGEVFREARRRREIGLVEVEEATRIRPRYLRAIEDEEWEALPGGIYTRGFIRTYGAFLGLDGDRLAEEYRESIEGASREWTAPQEVPQATRSTTVGLPRRRRSMPAAGWLAALAVLGIAALVIVLLPVGGGGGGTESGSPNHATSRPAPPEDVAKREHATTGSGVSVRLAASAEVWVCMLDGKGRQLVDGQILEEGVEEGPFRSGSFTVSFGNGEVSMLVDGQEADIPATSSPIGYSIDASGNLTELSEAERPTCT